MFEGSALIDASNEPTLGAFAVFIFGFGPVYTRRFPFNLGKDFVHPADVVLHLLVQNLGVFDGLFKMFDVFRAFHRAGLPNT
jgi:hypothetical protein